MPQRTALLAAWQPQLPLTHSTSRTRPSTKTPRCGPTHACTRPPSHPPRRTFLRLALSATLTLLPTPTHAVCGEPDPFFAHYLDWTESQTPLPDGRAIHYRLVGSRRKEARAAKYPILYLGDAGLALPAGEPLELLASADRRVLLADLLGVGDSAPLPTPPSPPVAAPLAAREAAAVLAAAGLSAAPGAPPQRLHVIAAGFGLHVAAALLPLLHGESPPNARVASVAAEAWTPPNDLPAVTFAAMQGNRVCAVEAAQAGDLSLARRLYAPQRADVRASAVDAIASLAAHVPTLALRTFGTPRLEERVANLPLFEDREFSQAGRVAHLAGTEDVLEALDQFFTKVEAASREDA